MIASVRSKLYAALGASLAALLPGCGACAKEAETTNEASSRIGINLHYAETWGRSRPFNNLIYGSNWAMQKSGGAWEDVPEDFLDTNKWVKATPTPDHRVVRGLSAPTTSAKVVCTFRGAGQLAVGGASVSNVVSTAGRTTFYYTSPYPQGDASAHLSYKIVDATNYIRDINCQEGTATGTYAPDFLATLKGFSVLRFVKWQPATEGNWAVTWAGRSKPGDGEYLAADGVPVELLIELVTLAGADPWVTMPWNADDDYVRRFATYVRDNLPADKQVYVEVSNEVWNGGYPVAAQARNEAIARGLPGASGGDVGGNLERYAEKTQQVMAIWSEIFAGQMKRLVRVAAFQHVAPYFSDRTLAYRDLHKSVDALSTAPYFGHELRETDSFESIMAALPGTVEASINLIGQQKAIAEKYALRYVAYEGGQHIVFPNNVGLLARVQSAPAMHEAYKRYLKGWQSNAGDTLVLFALQGGPSKYGSWGLVDWVGQPEAEAPKMRAVRDFIRQPTLGN